MTTSVLAMWRTFEHAVLPRDVSPVQRNEMCKAFYSGFACALGVQINELATMPDDDALRALETLWQECIAYVESTAQSRARTLS